MKHLRLVLRSIVRGLALALGDERTARDDAPPRPWSPGTAHAMLRGAALGYDRLEDLARELARL